ncbi:lipid A deacylase LpxR family protein [Tenacibaculum sp. IB213877]|uniref:lipid A deacylase LpxR family protein n=1 Tax=Tenacibaculum sp. IB213877 TaxID=3097351 RepID=UPI002A5A8999|nr:lipid A deacylase LpxR family protein [Tenacibaculum sp. IB213877]MDY0781176.1 lipid A deacylase LpxR family protein [Tenacibaculum sp. IB213877]
MKKTTLLLALLLSISALAQSKYSKEISFINDNDLYISTYRDRYYTNGMFFNYSYLSNKTSERIEKKIYQITIGHEMYTPYKAVVQSVDQHDRPFAGHLFGSFGISNFYKNNSFFKFTIQAGVLGESAKARELMDIVHRAYDFAEATGWDYQIKDALSLNFNASYLQKLTGNDSFFDLSWNNDARIGTIYTDFSTGFFGRIGFKPLQNITNSIAFKSNLNNQNTLYHNNTEVFIYFKPMISLVAYDATIEGSFFNNNSPVTYNVKPFKFSTEIGLRFTANRFNFGYSIFYHTKKLKSFHVPNSNWYGSIQINYLFN